MKHMKNLTYRNLMIVIKQIQAKGYDFNPVFLLMHEIGVFSIYFVKL